MGEDMSHRTRVFSVVGLLLTLTSSMAHALPPKPQSQAMPRAEAGDLMVAARDWLASLLGQRYAPAHPGTAGHRHSSPGGQEKEGTVLDPNGHQ